MFYHATASHPSAPKRNHSIREDHPIPASGKDKIGAILDVAAQSVLKYLPCVCVPALSSDFERTVFESSTMWSMRISIEGYAKRIRGFTVYRDRQTGDVWVYDAFFKMAALLGQTPQSLKDLEKAADKDILVLHTMLSEGETIGQ